MTSVRAIPPMQLQQLQQSEQSQQEQPLPLQKKDIGVATDPLPEKKNQVWADNVVADESIYADSFKLSARELIAHLNYIPYWQGMLLKRPNMQREFILKDHRKAQIFVNKVMDIAVRINHFPKITVISNKVLIGIRTSEVDGITQKDLMLAHHISNLKL